MGAKKLSTARILGRAIARKRMECGMTQEDVAEQLQIGYEAVSRIERGTVSPNLDRLFQLADIFSCGIADLLTESSRRPRDQADRLASLLQPLSEGDRQLVVEIVEKLSSRFHKNV